MSSFQPRETTRALRALTRGGVESISDSDIQLYLKNLRTAIDYREFGSVLRPNQDIGSGFQTCVDQLSRGESIFFHGKDPFLFSKGALIRRPVGIHGLGHTLTKFRFVPTTPGDKFLALNGMNIQFSTGNVTEDLQLDGGTIRDFQVVSDRSVWARGLSMLNCDNVAVRNLRFFGLNGHSMLLKNVRESSFSNVWSRYCGRIHKESFHVQSEADILECGVATWQGNIAGAVTANASAQTVNIGNRVYVDPDGVQRNLDTNINIWIDRGLPNQELVTITALTGTTMSAIFAKNHRAGATVTLHGDNTNLNYFTRVRSIFPFWHGRQLEETSAEYANKILVHMFDSPDSVNGQTMEKQVVGHFGGTLGFTSGVANNKYAELIQSVTGNEASTADLEYDPDGYAWAAPQAVFNSSDCRMSDFKLLGGRTNYGLLVCGNTTQATLDTSDGTVAGILNAAKITEVFLSNGFIGSIRSAWTGKITPSNFIGGAITADADTDILTAPSDFSVPPTGYPVMFKNPTNDANLPAGLLTNNMPMYVIKLSKNTFKVARTRQRALAGINVDITSVGGAGTHYVHILTGTCITTSDHGQVFVDPSVSLTNAFQPFMRDSYPAAVSLAPTGTGVFGLPRAKLFANPQQWPWTLSVGNPGGAGIRFGYTGEALGFYGVTPVVQPVGAAQAAVTGTAAATYDAGTQTLINSMATLVNKLRTDLVSVGIIKGSA